VYFSNLFLVIVTVGLAIPWTKVRLIKYRAHCMCFLEGETFNTIVAAEQNAQSALGEEAGDAMDLDFAL